MHTKRFMLIVSAAICAAALTANAKTLQEDADGLPYNEIERTDDGIEYVAGGIGVEAQERFNRVARERFNLKLVFSLNEGNYIADVNVAVKDSRGRTVVEEMADGPYLLAKIPPGRYTVTATYDGKTVTRTMQVGDRLRTAYLRWPSNPATDFLVPRHAGTKAGAAAESPPG